MRARTFGTAMALLLTLTPATAAPTDKPGRCFATTNFYGWKAPDEQTIFIRVGVQDFYRLDLANRCSSLHSLSAFLVTRWRGSNFVCSPLDWDLRVSRGEGLGAEGCIVKAMTPLTRAEADAIPRKFRP